jgi:hypothetical protein
LKPDCSSPRREFAASVSTVGRILKSAWTGASPFRRARSKRVQAREWKLPTAKAEGVYAERGEQAVDKAADSTTRLALEVFR